MPASLPAWVLLPNGLQEIGITTKKACAPSPVLCRLYIHVHMPCRGYRITAYGCATYTCLFFNSASPQAEPKRLQKASPTHPCVELDKTLGRWAQKRRGGNVASYCRNGGSRSFPCLSLFTCQPASLPACLPRKGGCHSGVRPRDTAEGMRLS
jgi:hypothetical protein